MLFNSVFDNLSEVRDAIERDRIDPSELAVNIDKNSVGVFLSDDEQYFDGYEDDSYYMSPDSEHEKQVLFYGEFLRVEDFCVELAGEFFGAEEYETLNYRANESSSNLT